MSDRLNLLKGILRAGEEGNVEKATSFLAENFVFEVPPRVPVNKEQFSGILHRIANAFSDFRFNESDFSEEGDVITHTLQLTGKHTGEYVRPDGVPIPATNKTFELPKEKSSVTFSGNKISILVIDSIFLSIEFFRNLNTGI